MVLVQSINDSIKERILEQQKNKERINLSTEENKSVIEYEKQIEELRAFKESVIPTLEQMKQAAIENEKYKKMFDKERNQKPMQTETLQFLSKSTLR